MADPSSLQWYYIAAHNPNERIGPVDSQEWDRLIAQGTVQADTLCWRSGMPGWLPHAECASAGQQGAAGQAESYSMDQMTFADETAVVAKAVQASAPKAATKLEGGKAVNVGKLEAALEREKEKVKAKASSDSTWKELKKTPSVYVEGLPKDATVGEVKEYFEKCGIIKLEGDGEPKIKLYANEAGVLKGDALVTYLKLPSVDLACQILDGSLFRPQGGGTLSVTPAKFEMKGDAFVKKKVAKGKKRKLNQGKSLDWGGFDDVQNAKDVTAVLRNMFDAGEMARDRTLRPSLEEDIKAECVKKCGEVLKVTVHSHRPEGVVMVKFKFPEAAAKCVSIMDGRWFAGKQIEADLYDGHTNWAAKVRKVESAEEQAKRLEAFAADLEK